MNCEMKRNYAVSKLKWTPACESVSFWIIKSGIFVTNYNQSFEVIQSNQKLEKNYPFVGQLVINFNPSYSL